MNGSQATFLLAKLSRLPFPFRARLVFCAAALRVPASDRVLRPEACSRSTKASWATTRFSFSRTRWLFSFSRSANFDMACPL